MAVRKLTKEEFCLVLQRIIFRLGPDYALRRDNSDRQLYSGPDWLIGNELKDAFRKAGLEYVTNREIAEAQAKREGAVRIDDTYIGKLLIRKDLLNYFYEVYKDRQQAIEAEYHVWAWASRAFVSAGSDKAFTAACGASPVRIYLREELQEMNKWRNYETLNDKFADAELEIFKRDGNNFQRRTSLIELRRTLQAARKEVQERGTTIIAKEYYRRKEFYLLQRRNQFVSAGRSVPKVYDLSFVERRRREAIFVLGILNLQPGRPFQVRAAVSEKVARS